MARKFQALFVLAFLVLSQPADARLFGRNASYWASQGRCTPCGFFFRPLLRVATLPFRILFPFRYRAYSPYYAPVQAYPNFVPPQGVHGAGPSPVPAQRHPVIEGSVPHPIRPTPSTTVETDFVQAQKEMNKYIASHPEGHALYEKWKQQHPSLSPYQTLLLFAVEEANGKSISGNLTPRLCAPKVQEEAGLGAIRQINTRSWSDGGSSVMTHARACVSRWNGSPQSQRLLTVFHENYCVAMARNSDGSYDCSARFQNRKNTDE